MRVTVLATAPEDVGVLRCATASGELAVRWRGVPAPAPGESRDVELDVVGELTWGQNVGLVDAAPRSSAPDTLVGTVEAIDGELVTFRVGDGLVLAEVLGQPPSAALGRSAFVQPQSLEAWPTGL